MTAAQGNRSLRPPAPRCGQRQGSAFGIWPDVRDSRAVRLWSSSGSSERVGYRLIGFGPEYRRPAVCPEVRDE